MNPSPKQLSVKDGRTAVPPNNLTELLAIAVPRHIAKLKGQGGPEDKDYEAVHAFSDVLGAQGDNLLFRAKEKGKTARLFNSLAYALAVCAFAPGGITFAGEHYEANL